MLKSRKTVVGGRRSAKSKAEIGKAPACARVFAALRRGRSAVKTHSRPSLFGYLVVKTPFAYFAYFAVQFASASFNQLPFNDLTVTFHPVNPVHPVQTFAFGEGRSLSRFVARLI
jgi:hypothetical protein